MEPQFEGQTKTKLGNSEVIGAVQTAVSDALKTFLEEHPKQARTIVDKVILAAQARHAAYNARAKVQRKSPLGGGGLLVNLPTARHVRPKTVSFFLSRVILPAVQQSRVVTVSFRRYCLCAEKF